MTRGLGGLVLMAGLGLLSGCRMCAQTPEDYTYAAYGGLIQRGDMLHGRVGSAFSPAEGVPAGAEHGAPYEGEIILEPEYAAKKGQASPSQATETAFDPGDILVSGSR